MKCLNCGKSVKQTQGKRAKSYCDANCRQKHWLKNNKKKSERGPGRPKKIVGTLVGTFANDTPSDKPFDQKKSKKASKTKSGFKFFTPAVQPKTDEYGMIPPAEEMLKASIEYNPTESFDAEKLPKTTNDEPVKWQEAEVVKTELHLPTKFSDLLTMAKEGVLDKEAFMRHAKSAGLNSNQLSMIIAKLK